MGCAPTIAAQYHLHIIDSGVMKRRRVRRLGSSSSKRARGGGVRGGDASLMARQTRGVTERLVEAQCLGYGEEIAHGDAISLSEKLCSTYEDVYDQRQKESNPRRKGPSQQQPTPLWSAAGDCRKEAELFKILIDLKVEREKERNIVGSVPPETSQRMAEQRLLQDPSFHGPACFSTIDSGRGRDSDHTTTPSGNGDGHHPHHHHHQSGGVRAGKKRRKILEDTIIPRIAEKLSEQCRWADRFALLDTIQQDSLLAAHWFSAFDSSMAVIYRQLLLLLRNCDPSIVVMNPHVITTTTTAPQQQENQTMTIPEIVGRVFMFKSGSLIGPVLSLELLGSKSNERRWHIIRDGNVPIRRKEEQVDKSSRLLVLVFSIQHTRRCLLSVVLRGRKDKETLAAIYYTTCNCIRSSIT